MQKKVFISYSHKDESFRETLEEHLSILKRNDIISVWHDRKITPGEEWAGEIDKNLENADIIIFLVSSSFLASNYCQDVEVKKALEHHDQGIATIISIIVRPCDWKESKFSKIQVVPKEGTAINEWDNEDRAWLDAVEGIKSHLKRFEATKTEKEIPDNENGITLRKEVLSWLSDTEITLTHRRVNKIGLNDIYVVPDLSQDDENEKELASINSASRILNDLGWNVISGEEQQGKTSLLKYFYVEILKNLTYPLYINGSDINKADSNRAIKKAIREQYVDLELEQYLSFKNKVILIDNFNLIHLNRKFRDKFLDEINETFNNIIVTCDNSFNYVLGEIPEFDSYRKYGMLGLGNKKREEIVQKWISLGIEENIEDVELYSRCDDLEARLNTVIKKNIVPPKPIYILMLLQMFEANNQFNLELTSYGHCYQQLIYQSFDNAKIVKQDFDKYLNVLTELSWWIFINDQQPNEYQLDVFFDEYSSTFLPVDKENTIEKLTSHSILTNFDSRVGFKYPYIYYFFVGKKIAESYSDSSAVKDQVSRLLNLLHREDYANILIFIAHHTKDSWVLTETKKVLSELFFDQGVAILDKKQLSFMNEFMEIIPELVMEQREIQKERDSHNERLDEMERLEKGSLDKAEEAEESRDILADINKTFKGMEIAGQIIRNRHASLTRSALNELAEDGISTGLRFLNYFINISDTAKNEIVKLISNHLIDDPSLTDKEIERYAESAYLHLTYSVIFGVIKKIASSIGSKEALEIYSELEKLSGSPAYSLIRLSIELHFERKLKIGSLKETVEKLHDNPVCMRILRELVIQHVYMFPVDFKEKQQLSELLNISVKSQRLMDRDKSMKA